MAVLYLPDYETCFSVTCILLCLHAEIAFKLLLVHVHALQSCKQQLYRRLMHDGHTMLCSEETPRTSVLCMQTLGVVLLPMSLLMVDGREAAVYKVYFEVLLVRERVHYRTCMRKLWSANSTFC